MSKLWIVQKIGYFTSSFAFSPKCYCRNTIFKTVLTFLSLTSRLKKLTQNIQPILESNSLDEEITYSLLPQLRNSMVNNMDEKDHSVTTQQQSSQKDGSAYTSKLHNASIYNNYAQSQTRWSRQCQYIKCLKSFVTDRTS